MDARCRINGVGRFLGFMELWHNGRVLGDSYAMYSRRTGRTEIPQVG